MRFLLFKTRANMITDMGLLEGAKINRFWLCPLDDCPLMQFTEEYNQLPDLVYYWTHQRTVPLPLPAP